MKFTGLLCVLLAGCAMTPTQKKAAIGVGAFLAIGAIAASRDHHESANPQKTVTIPRDPCATPIACH